MQELLASPSQPPLWHDRRAVGAAMCAVLIAAAEAADQEYAAAVAQQAALAAVYCARTRA